MERKANSLSLRERGAQVVHLTNGGEGINDTSIYQQKTASKSATIQTVDLRCEKPKVQL
jgi:hypothetical protein